MNLAMTHSVLLHNTFAARTDIDPELLSCESCVGKVRRRCQNRSRSKSNRPGLRLMQRINCQSSGNRAWREKAVQQGHRDPREISLGVARGWVLL